MRILSLDGGGYLGLATAAFLKEAERHFRISCHERFDLFCGTSTGAIIALALASGMTAEAIEVLYKDFGPKVFRNSGHAVAIFQRGACFQCGFTAAGKPHLEVTTWPDETGVHQEPACGAFFTPYGPIELLPSHALIAELATDVILGQIATARHRVWIGRQSFIAATGGAWADVWCRLVGDPGDGGFLVDRIWDTNTACSVGVDARCA